MKHRSWILLLVIVCWATAMRANRLEGYTYLFPIDSATSFRSVGNVRFLNDINGATDEPLSGTHSVAGPDVFDHPVSGAGEYFYILEGPAEPGNCYSTMLNAQADPVGLGSYSETWYGPETRCATSGGDDGEGHFHEEGGSPIVINLASGGPWVFADASDPVSFDLEADGVPERWTWTATGSRIAFLALDRNGNGRIDNGRELFGDQDGDVNGFEALRNYDNSRDGQITESDAVWPYLLLWIDANHNGVSETDELEGVMRSGLEALRLDYHWTAREDRSANSLRYQALARVGGRTEPYYDVFFRRVN